MFGFLQKVGKCFRQLIIKHVIDLEVIQSTNRSCNSARCCQKKSRHCSCETSWYSYISSTIMRSGHFSGIVGSFPCWTWVTIRACKWKAVAGALALRAPEASSGGMRDPLLNLVTRKAALQTMAGLSCPSGNDQLLVHSLGLRLWPRRSNFDLDDSRPRQRHFPRWLCTFRDRPSARSCRHVLR